MSSDYTGIYAEALTIADFDDTAYDGISIIANVPVFLRYTVPVANEIAFGVGATSVNGVRSARILQINPMDEQATPAYIACKYRLVYEDANLVRSSVLRSDLTDNVKGVVTIPNQFNYLAEAATRVGYASYLTIQLVPLATSAGHTFKTANSAVYIPITRYTLANASGN